MSDIDVVIPSPRSGVPFAQADDEFARDLLAANEIASDPGALEAALTSGSEAIQAAAARVAGADGAREVIPALLELARSDGDTERAGAAYALARLGREEGVATLHELLEVELEGAVAAPLAAGSLARLGDPAGIPVLDRALRSPDLIIRQVACKQLYFVHGLDPERAGALFAIALEDPSPLVSTQARAELNELPDA